MAGSQPILSIIRPATRARPGYILNTAKMLCYNIYRYPDAHTSGMHPSYDLPYP